MKKSTVIVSSVILCFILVGLIAGISAAWFGDVNSRSDTIIITSARPKGQATIDINSTDTTSSASDGMLSPAKIKAGLLLDPSFAGLPLPPTSNGAPGVLNGSLVDSSASDATKPLLSTASTVTVIFPFMYLGAPDPEATADSFPDMKAIIMDLVSVTLENPRSDDPAANAGELTNYIDEFDYKLRIVKAARDADDNVVVERTPDKDEFNRDAVKNNDKDTVLWLQSVESPNQMQMLVKSGIELYFEFTVYFKSVDEECSPQLLDKKLFFNFQIRSTNNRTQIPELMDYLDKGGTA